MAEEVHLLEGPDEIYETCDYITLHLPLNDATRQMIDGAVFADETRHGAAEFLSG